MDKKDIGIKKNRVLISFLLVLLTVAFGLICFFVLSNYGHLSDYEYLSKNGIEVEAEIVDCIYHREANHSTGNWVLIYEYKSEWGTVYRESIGHYSSESVAQEYLGKKITVIIDPNSSSSYSGLKLEDIITTPADYAKGLSIAIIFSIPVPIVLYLLIYRCTYRNVLNKKIKKKVYGSTYNNDRIIHTPLPNTVTQGEVTKVIKWIVCYVKVKYQDENGKLKEKWARAWFSHREAKFLKRKKFINIVPYKNTYGILEEILATQ